MIKIPETTILSAIETIKSIHFRVRNEIEEIKCVELQQAVKTAISALENQIPKKPEITLTGTTGWNTKTFCSVCKKEVLSGNYCIHCGQALKWNEVQEYEK